MCGIIANTIFLPESLTPLPHISRQLDSDHPVAKNTKRPSGSHRVLLILLVVLTALVGGILTGNWIAERHKVPADRQRMDEYLGFGERTSLTGQVTLQVDPRSLSITAGQPAKVKLTLTNKGKSPVRLNDWLEPAPASLLSNQFPFKVNVTKDGRRVRYQGNYVLPLPHTRKDFFALSPGKSKDILVDLSVGAGNGRWDMSSPGIYTVEVWYETYLTGRYIDVDAWTGTTNHVIVQISVAAAEGKKS